MADVTNWLDKPAIQWSSLSEACAEDGNDHASSNQYWDKEGMLPSTTSPQTNDDCSNTSCSSIITQITYREMFHLTTKIVERLRTLLPETTQSCGIPIVVAIPEGPFLPLAILAVHLLNTTHHVDSNYAILVPMEPGEGKERLVHMMSDARPALVLLLSQNADSTSSDWTKLEDVIDQADCGDHDYVFRQETSTQRLAQAVLRSSQPQLVDFAKLVRQIREDDNESSSPCSMCQPPLIASNAMMMFWDIFDEPEKESRHRDDVSHRRISHICYTSGTTGAPKGCISSRAALRHYLSAKNEAHGISGEDTNAATVLLCSALSFDPCLSDILATFQGKATLVLAPRKRLLQHLASVIHENHVTHVLCTPTLWGMVSISDDEALASLQVVALGGEPIPKRIVRSWANRVQLYATYGVTEACVYQTIGQVEDVVDEEARSTLKRGQYVGKAFRGLQVRIVQAEDSQLAGLNESDVGEVVLSGAQLDLCSGYWNQSELTANRFISLDGDCYYKTGDKGHIDKDGNLFILGRIEGQGGMVKVNGVRVELGEIEAALIDDAPGTQQEPSVVDACLAVARPSNPANSDSSKQIHAFCVLSQQCSSEMELVWNNDTSGVVVSGGPLLVLLRMRCLSMVRAGSMPSVFVLINRIPLSPTGKSDRRSLPQLSQCIALEALHDSAGSVLLKGYGKSGTKVSNVIVDILNLQPCQQSMLTTSSNFAMLGGDSLAATRVVRTLYANHNDVHNSRFLGGAFGTLDGAFSVSNLLLARTLGDYADWLDASGVCGSNSQNQEPSETSASSPIDETNKAECQQYDALLEATTAGHTAVAIGLLNAGVDPNIGGHGGRLSKVSSRNERKKIFKSNPLHVACNKGDPALVRKLLAKSCKFNSPDASGNFPLHMAASGTAEAASKIDFEKNDLDRTECVSLLLSAGVPLSMKDSNKQLVLHSAARAGHCHMLRYLMIQWDAAVDSGIIKLKTTDTKNKAGKFDWMDRWYRTPVHWAVLNGKEEALKILLQAGYSASPPTPSHKAKKQTSVQVESPLEICERLYNDLDPKWHTIRQLLCDALCERAI